MNWQEACEHPSLRNLPFKIELNEFGKIVMAPVRVNHSIYQAEIAHLMLLMCSDGKAMVECAIHTRMGTKAADVAWASRERFEQIRHEVECSIAPEVCVEVSPPATPLRKCAKNKGCTLKQGPKKFGTVMRMAA